jgi:hypothetical protein
VVVGGFIEAPYHLPYSAPASMRHGRYSLQSKIFAKP